MRSIRTVGACAVALAMSGIGAVSASAEEYPLTGLPEIGRCVKAPTPKTGKFNYKNCLGVNKKEGGNHGEYNWFPGPGEKGTFKANISWELVTVAGSKVRCTGGNIVGEFLNGKEVKVTSITLGGCTNVTAGKNCFSNILEPGTIESNQELVGEIGFIPNVKRPANPFVGVDLKASPEGAPFMTFNCGEELGAEAFVIEGSVIGRLKYLNKMLPYNGLYYTQKEGKQLPESFIGGVKDTLFEKVTKIAEPGKKVEEEVALAGSGEVALGEPLEIKAKQH